jgi:phosphoesterase RecJ-like protein
MIRWKRRLSSSTESMKFQSSNPFFEAIRQQLAVPSRFLITAHKDPDADAIGSCLAFKSLCESKGCEAMLWLQDPVPGHIKGLPGASDITHTLDLAGPIQALFVLDCSNAARIRGGDPLLAHCESLGIPVFNIDHHADNPHFGTYAWVEPAASSTGEMITELSSFLEWTPSPEAATCLYAAVAFDTGRFLFSNVSPSTFRCAAYLMECGADTIGVSRNMFENMTEDDFEVIKIALQRLVVHPSRFYAYTSLPASIEQTGLKVIDVIRQLGGVSLFLSFDEQTNGEVKVSLRSRDVNVQALAAKHGGGGHIQAAGITLTGTLDDVMAKVIESLPTA